ncbi:MAG: hypothetical protein Q8K79_20575 [Solirubrobacteraceae bacterium]|nr:hypothetical protein [Solirubrobacteraceae bacterium]
MTDPSPGPAAGGRVVYVDEHGQARRLPADLSELSPESRDAAIAAMSQALGARPDAARVAALERLTELRAAGRMSEEQYRRERRRIEEY